MENLAFFQFYYSSLWCEISETTPLNTETHKDLYKKYLSAKEVLNKYCVTQEIFISQECATILNNYLESHEINKPQDFPLDTLEICDYCNKQAELASAVIINFRNAAKKELKSRKLFKPIA